MNALICWGVNFLPSIVTDQSVPMWRLTERMVRSTLVTACRFATSPTSTSPFLAKATTDGVVREPSALAMTVGSPPSRTATTEFVVPRSIPTARAMGFQLLRERGGAVKLSELGSRLDPVPLDVKSAGPKVSPSRSTSSCGGAFPQVAGLSRALSPLGFPRLWPALRQRRVRSDAPLPQ